MYRIIFIRADGRETLMPGNHDSPLIAEAHGEHLLESEPPDTKVLVLQVVGELSKSKFGICKSWR